MNFAFLKSLLRRSLSWRPRPYNVKGRLGQSGERVAVRHLRRTGHRILARNYDCPAGEIDLVAGEGDIIAFIEVKSRSDSPALNHPQFGVRPNQQERIGKAARYFLRQTRAESRPCRFDILTVTWSDVSAPKVEHFKDAFRPHQRQR